MYGKSRAMRSQQFQVYGGVSVIGVQLIATHYTDTVFVYFFLFIPFYYLKVENIKRIKINISTEIRLKNVYAFSSPMFDLFD